MAELKFEGIVSGGISQHTTLLVPGRNALRVAPADWPEELYPGSLNVRIAQYPDEFRQRGFANSVIELDRGCFAPEFEILRNEFGNNQLGPRPGFHRGGDGQVWRATLSVATTGIRLDCWALRRFGSQVGEQLEFVSGHRLRDGGLEDGIRIRVSLWGTWRDA